MALQTSRVTAPNLIIHRVTRATLFKWLAASSLRIIKHCIVVVSAKLRESVSYRASFLECGDLSPLWSGSLGDASNADSSDQQTKAPTGRRTPNYSFFFFGLSMPRSGT